jgi:hypothetical protein
MAGRVQYSSSLKQWPAGRPREPRRIARRCLRCGRALVAGLRLFVETRWRTDWTTHDCRTLAQAHDVLGYARYGAQGGDWGSAITTELGRSYPGSVLGIHINNTAGGSAPPDAEQSSEERAWRRAGAASAATEGDYAGEQRNKPQTVAFALTDNPLGAAGWTGSWGPTDVGPGDWAPTVLGPGDWTPEVLGPGPFAPTVLGPGSWTPIVLGSGSSDQPPRNQDSGFLSQLLGGL